MRCMGFQFVGPLFAKSRWSDDEGALKMQERVSKPTHKMNTAKHTLIGLTSNSATSSQVGGGKVDGWGVLYNTRAILSTVLPTSALKRQTLIMQKPTQQATHLTQAPPLVAHP